MGFRNEQALVIASGTNKQSPGQGEGARVILAGGSWVDGAVVLMSMHSATG